MKKILLTTDFSENSWNAIVYALKFLEKTTCTFYVLHVDTLGYEKPIDSTYLQTNGVVESTYTKSAKKQLKSILKQISLQFVNNKNHHFFTLTDYNFFIDAVRSHVIEKQIDLIVMGTKGSGGLKKVIVGSNAADVIKRVKCNTLVVPEEAKFSNLDEIAFPTDYYLTYGIKLLKPIYDLLKSHHSKLHILHITNKLEELNHSQQDNKDVLNDYFNGFKPNFHNLINNNVENAVENFVQNNAIKMVAMVAKNLNYFQSMFFHSKVEKITYHTHIPFLVLHE